ncbi:MAG: N-(5'-phosphoribosyl)anthranilate isomerase [Rhodosalinus sp.]
MPDHLTPERWLAQVFSSGEAARGGIVKRQIADVDRIAGRDAFLAEVERRGFQAVQNGRHYVVFCNAWPIRRLR